MTTLRNGQYVVERLLGEGALGRTHAARRTRDDLPVAIKELLPSRLKTWKDFELFEREAKLLRALDHPGVPKFHDAFEEEDENGHPRLFLVQELIDGHTLEDELVEHGVFTELQVRQIAHEILQVLVYLHGRDTPVLHRDIKPANLMRRSDGRVVLIDFGAVAEVLDGEQVGGSGTLVGTFGYMPPEQYAGTALPQTDLYALGASLVHLLTGIAPERLFGSLFQIVLPPELNVSPGFGYWLARMIDPDPLHRFSSAQEALSVLESGFLMQTLQRPQAAELLTANPGPAPRNLPRLFLRDQHSGGSIQIRIAIAIAAMFVNVIALALSIWIGRPELIIVAAFMLPLGIGMASATVRKYRDALWLYRNGVYSLGEVTHTFLDVQFAGSRRIVYRYLDGSVLREATLVTRYRKARELAPGDAIGVLYEENAVGHSMIMFG